jgi:hypothetical protein
VQREPAPDAVQDGHRGGVGDALDEHGVVALPHRELHVVSGDEEDVLHERKRDLPQAQPAGRE